MTFWQQVQAASNIGPAFVWLVLIFVVSALALSAMKPAERPRIRNSLFLFALSLVGLLIVASLANFGVSQTRASYRWLQRSEEHTSELQSLAYLVCRLLLEKKKKIIINTIT